MKRGNQNSEVNKEFFLDKNLSYRTLGLFFKTLAEDTRIPTFTLQDKVFDHVKMVIWEAEEEGKLALTPEELLEKTYASFQE